MMIRCSGGAALICPGLTWYLNDSVPGYGKMQKLQNLLFSWIRM